MMHLLGLRIFDRWLIGAAGVIAVLAIAVVLTCRSTAELDEDASWVSHTLEVISALDEARSHMLRAHAIERSYVILGGETFPPQFAENIAFASWWSMTTKIAAKAWRCC
jgi:CHASE3 domain sensor protein